MDVNKLLTSKINRRRMLGNLGMMGAGAVLTACGGAIGQKPGKENIDTAVLNFALNLEYLEAEFYLAAVGKAPTYATSGAGTAGTVTGGKAVNFANDLGGALSPEFRAAVQAYAEEIAQDEERHVIALRGALGGEAVARPNINIGGGVGGAFGTAAKAAGMIAGVDAATQTQLETFDPYDNALFFLHGAFVFEDVGVTAYKGAARLLTDDSEGGVLDTAAGILAVEAYHAGEIRTLLYQFKDAMAFGLTVEQIVGAISALRAALGGGKDQGIVLNGKANIVVTDDNAVAYGRSTREVLNIVYGAPNAEKGLFFPDGLNGAITK